MESESWEEALARLRRADALRQDEGPPPPLIGDAGPALERLRATAGPLLQAVAGAYAGLCPPGYPALDDNGIPGPGGSTGLRLPAAGTPSTSPWSTARSPATWRRSRPDWPGPWG